MQQTLYILTILGGKDILFLAWYFYHRLGIHVQLLLNDHELKSVWSEQGNRQVGGGVDRDDTLILPIFCFYYFEILLFFHT